MIHGSKVEWTRLDNASKIFPSTYSKKDTKVFRLVCELYDLVKPDTLQQALNVTIESFPLYKSVLRRGFFWYYLENSNIKPIVKVESNPVCAPIYFNDKKTLLFRVFYYKNRISLELFHVLSDGTGALWFIQTLVYQYLILLYKTTFSDNLPKLSYSASISEKKDDSFGRYFVGDNLLNRTLNEDEKDDNTKSYHIQGTRTVENRMKLIEGCMSVQDVLKQAHEYETTLTVFITSLFIYSIYKDMPNSRRNHPVILSVPINLRQFFKSVTARNFFSTMNIGYQFGTNKTEFKDVIQRVSDCFQKELTEQRLNERLEHFMSLEKNLFTRIVPLPIKDISLRIASRRKDLGITAALSNIGRISMPLEFDSYIKQFAFSTSARRPQICMCSYGDRLVVSFTSPFQDTDIQRTFFQFLSSNGIEIEISSNI